MKLNPQKDQTLNKIHNQKLIEPEVCDTCHGSGMKNELSCSSCNGKGIL